MELSVYGLFLLSFLLIVLCGWLFTGRQRKRAMKRICLIVLGDLGRSPRMQYHTMSFAKEGFQVDLVGFANSPLIPELQDHRSVRLLALHETPKKPSFLPQIIYYIFKTIFLFLQLLFLVLLKTTVHSHVLIQNPPAIPTIAAAWCICLLRRSQFIIDWHNYGYTILSMTLAKRHPLVKFSKCYEGVFGRRADHNICVTRAMKKDLMERWGITATTLYDRPPHTFHSIDIKSRHEIFLKLSVTYNVFTPALNKQSTSETRFSMLINKKATMKADRPALIVSSTSWTEDEDFSILLKALEIYDQETVKKTNSKLPKIVCVITGKGPLKEHYQKVMETLVFQNVYICTPWLDSGDYPKLIGSADLGICLHTSSSGLDLPMKVVDMFGCGVPVCAVGFSCLHELVTHEENGLVFKNAEELAEQLKEVLCNFPGNQEHLEKFRENLKEFQSKQWHASWKETFHDKIFL